MKVQEILTRTSQYFKQKGLASARLDSELLISSALGWRRLDLYLKMDYPVSSSELDRCREFVRRRATGEPVAYILGEKEFYGRSFAVSRDVLIPRPETEHLIDEAVKLLRLRAGEEALPIVDMGVGSGCIGLTLLKEFTHAKLLACDISVQALAVTASNAQRLEVSERLVTVHQPAQSLTREQVIKELGALAVMVVANPPYIAPGDPEVQEHVVRFEPREALFAGQEGLEFLYQWSDTASRLLQPGGYCLCEIGAKQGRAVASYLEKRGHWHSIDVLKDYSGHDRVVVAKLAPEGGVIG